MNNMIKKGVKLQQWTHKGGIFFLIPFNIIRELNLTKRNCAIWTPINNKKILLKIRDWNSSHQYQTRIVKNGKTGLRTSVPVTITRKSFIVPGEYIKWSKISKTEIQLKIEKEKKNKKTTKLIKKPYNLEVNIPALICRESGLKPGLYFNWEKVSNDTFTVNITEEPIPKRTKMKIFSTNPCSNRLSLIIPQIHWINYNLSKGMYVDLEVLPEKREILFTPIY